MSVPVRSVMIVVGAHSQQVGSFERHLLAVIEATTTAGVGCVVVYPSEPADPAYRVALVDAGASVEVVACRGLGDARFARALRRLIAQTRPDIVHAHFEPAAPVAAAVARSMRCQVVMTRHYLAPNGPWSAHGMLTRTLGRVAQRHLAVSEPVARSLIEMGVPAGQVEVSYLGVDTDHFSPASSDERAEARADLGVPDGQVVVACTSHHRAGKGVEHLVEALADPRCDGVVGLIAGDGPRHEALVSQARSGGSRARFVGRIPDVRPLLAAADVYCLPTVDYPEGLPMATLEAMATGTAVLATPVPAVVPLLGTGAEPSGVIVEAASPSALAEALAGLAADPDRRHRLGRAGRVRAMEMDLDRCAGSIVELYTGATTGAGRS